MLSVTGLFHPKASCCWSQQMKLLMTFIPLATKYWATDKFWKEKKWLGKHAQLLKNRYHVAIQWKQLMFYRKTQERSTETEQRYWTCTCLPSPTCWIPAITSSFSYSVFSLSFFFLRKRISATLKVTSLKISLFVFGWSGWCLPVMSFPFSVDRSSLTLLTRWERWMDGGGEATSANQIWWEVEFWNLRLPIGQSFLIAEEGQNNFSLYWCVDGKNRNEVTFLLLYSTFFFLRKKC